MALGPYYTPLPPLDLSDCIQEYWTNLDPIGQIPGKVREYYKLLHMHYTGNIIKVRKE